MVDDTVDQEKWYKTTEGHFYIGLVACLVLGIIMSFFVQSQIDARQAELIREQNSRYSAISEYFHSDNIMISDSSFGSNRYEVLTEKGQFVVELNEDSSKVIKALPISAE